MLVLGLAGMVATQAVAAQVKTYDNTSNLTGSWVGGPGNMYVDDINTTSSAQLTGVDVGYYCPEGETTNIVMLFYAGPGSFCSGGSTIENVGAGTGIIHYDFTSPITAPGQNFWLGVFTTNANAGLLLATNPTIGSSTSQCFITGPGAPLYGDPSTLNGSLAIATYSAPVPEPGTFAALATGLTGLLAFRRKRA